MTFPHPSYGRGRQSPELRAKLLERLETIPDLTGIVRGYGSFVRPE